MNYHFSHPKRNFIAHTMANIALLTSNEPETGGIAFIFDNNLAKSVSWRSLTPIADTLAMAKDCTAQVLDSLMKSPKSPAIEAAIRDTNWVSAVAGAQHQVKAWNERLASSHRAAPACG